jgi:hypothetical protein
VKVSRTTRFGVTIPSFEAGAPRIEVVKDDPRFREMVRVLMRMGLSPLKADEDATRAILALFEGSYATKLKQFVAFYGREFARRHGTLEGYDATMMARVFVPEMDARLRNRKNSIAMEMVGSMRR